MRSGLLPQLRELAADDRARPVRHDAAAGHDCWYMVEPEHAASSVLDSLTFERHAVVDAGRCDVCGHVPGRASVLLLLCLLFPVESSTVRGVLRRGSLLVSG